MLQHETNEIAADKPAAAGDEKTHGRVSSREMNGAATVWYQCQRCANCCRWPGLVRLTEADIVAISGFLGLGEYEFIQRFTRLRPQRDGLALNDKPNGECIFLNGIDCTIQAVKPRQCKGFPNEWNFPGWEKSCEAIPIPRWIATTKASRPPRRRRTRSPTESRRKRALQ
ncbi:MAG: YkgJ family cysteine cluster protein [Chthoniobacterales bacterium]